MALRTYTAGGAALAQGGGLTLHRAGFAESDDGGWRPGDLKYSGISISSLTGTQEPQAGFLLCNGAAVSRTTYKGLFDAIGTAFGSGDGSTTFNLPDYRQRFPLGQAASGTGATRGETGGSIDHVHNMDHEHDIDHVHTIDHSHSLAHTHSLSAHTHTVASHTHTLGSHTHGMNSHTHAVDPHTHTVPNHQHSGGLFVGNPTQNVQVQAGSSYSVSQFNHSHATPDTGGTIGGTLATSATGPSTGAPSPSTTEGPSTNTSGAASPATGAPSSDVTGASSVATLAHSGNSGTGGGTVDIVADTLGANPAFQVANWLVKY